MIARWASSSGRSGGGRAARPTARGLAVRGTHGGASGSGKPGPSRRVALRPATSFRTRRSSNMVASSSSSCEAARQAERETWRRRRRDGASSLTLHPAGGAPSARSVRHMRRPRAMGSPSVAVSAVDREHPSAREGLSGDAVLGAQPYARPLTGSGPGLHADPCIHPAASRIGPSLACSAQIRDRPHSRSRCLKGALPRRAERVSA